MNQIMLKSLGVVGLGRERHAILSPSALSLLSLMTPVLKRGDID